MTVGGANASGSPTLSGSGSIAGTVTVASGNSGVAGHLAPSGISGAATNMNLNGGLMLADGSGTPGTGAVLDFNLGTPSGSDSVTTTSLYLGLDGVLNFNGALTAGQDYPLIDFTDALLSSDNSSTWTVGTHVGDSGHTYGFQIANGTGGTNVFELVVSGGTVAGTWISNSNTTPGTNFSNASNWDSNPSFPHNPGDTATFGTGSAGTESYPISIGAPYSLGILNFTNTGYTLSAAGSGDTLTMNNNGSGAQVNVAANVYTLFEGPMVLADASGATTFNIGAGGTLEISSGPASTAISGSNQLVLNGTGGGGILQLDSPNTYIGATSVKAGTLLIMSTASIASTSISVSAGATLQLAGTTAALPSTANITNGTGSGANGNFVMTDTATQTVGTISGASYLVPDSNSVNATAYSGNTTVGDGIERGQPHRDADSAKHADDQRRLDGDDRSVGPARRCLPSPATLRGRRLTTPQPPTAAMPRRTSDPFTAIQAAIASGAISSTTGQVLENRIAAIERLAATDPGLDVSLLESRVLSVLPLSSTLVADSSPIVDGGSVLLTLDSSALGTGSAASSASAAFAPSASFAGSPSAVPEPSTLLLAALAAIGLAVAARRRTIYCV